MSPSLLVKFLSLSLSLCRALMYLGHNQSTLLSCQTHWKVFPFTWPFPQPTPVEASTIRLVPKIICAPNQYSVLFICQ
jgi:hypothetical protein